MGESHDSDTTYYVILVLPVQFQSVKRVRYVWWVEKLVPLEDWSFVPMASGVDCATVSSIGELTMPK